MQFLIFMFTASLLQTAWAVPPVSLKVEWKSSSKNLLLAQAVQIAFQDWSKPESIALEISLPEKSIGFMQTQVQKRKPCVSISCQRPLETLSPAERVEVKDRIIFYEQVHLVGPRSNEFFRPTSLLPEALFNIKASKFGFLSFGGPSNLDYFSGVHLKEHWYWKNLNRWEKIPKLPKSDLILSQGIKLSWKRIAPDLPKEVLNQAGIQKRFTLIDAESWARFPIEHHSLQIWIDGRSSQTHPHTLNPCYFEVSDPGLLNPELALPNSKAYAVQQFYQFLKSPEGNYSIENFNIQNILAPQVDHTKPESLIGPIYRGSQYLKKVDFSAWRDTCLSSDAEQFLIDTY